MNNVPREKLREIVARHGRTVIEDPRRCEGLLRDYCGEYRREVTVLVMALEEHVAADLIAAPSGTPHGVTRARLAQRLSDNLALSEAAARWAVDSWALALGAVSDDELAAVEHGTGGRTETAATPSSGAESPSSGAATPATVTATPSAVAAAASAKLKQPTHAASADIIISASGGGDYTSIGAALRNAAPGARLLVRPGLYDEAVIIDKRVELVGDGAAEEIIIRSNDASCIQMRADEATISGLTIRGSARDDDTAFFAVDIPHGRLTLDRCDINSDTLSCVAVHGATADPLIRRCRIHDGADSGVYFFDGAAGTLEECEVYGNANVGVAITAGANPVVRRSVVRDGANAGVVVWKDGRGLVESCEIYGNRLAGIGISEGGNPTVHACHIYEGGNSGVFVHQGGEGTLEHCDIFGHAQAEVAITSRGNLIMRGCRIHQGRDSGIVVREEGQALLQECVVEGNAHSGVVVGAGALVAVRQCHVEGNGRVAVKVEEGGTASVEDSDLVGNFGGAWDVEDGAFVESAGNREG